MTWLILFCRAAAGLVDYVETLLRNPETEYNVMIFLPYPFLFLHNNSTYIICCKSCYLLSLVVRYFGFHDFPVGMSSAAFMSRNQSIGCFYQIFSVTKNNKRTVYLLLTKSALCTVTSHSLRTPIFAPYGRLLFFKWMELNNLLIQFMFFPSGNCGWDSQKGRQ